MKRILKILLTTLLITLIIAPNIVSAEEVAKKQLKSGWVDHPKGKGVGMLQYGDFSELPGIPVYDAETGAPVSGKITYPNLDKGRLGTYDLEWLFTPDDTTYEPLYGTMRVSVRAPEYEATEEPTTPSLTASAVLLDTMTTYDINLDNKVTGSTYIWTSSDAEVVEVNAKSGLLKAKSTGKANVSCKIILPDATIQTLVSEVIVGLDDNAPLLTETTLDLETGDVFDINLENKVVKSKYRWVSSNRAVATVNSANGKVTAVSTGTAYVTCMITTPTNQVVVLRCDIIITAPTVATE